MAANKGTQVVTFAEAAGYGSNAASQAVSDATITAGAYVEAWIMAEASTEHSAENQALISQFCSPTCSAADAGVGFTIYLRSEIAIRGKVKVRWVWSD